MWPCFEVVCAASCTVFHALVFIAITPFLSCVNHAPVCNLNLINIQASFISHWSKQSVSFRSERRYRELSTHQAPLTGQPDFSICYLSCRWAANIRPDEFTNFEQIYVNLNSSNYARQIWLCIRRHRVNSDVLQCLPSSIPINRFERSTLIRRSVRVKSCRHRPVRL